MQTNQNERPPPLCSRCRYFSDPAGTPICGFITDIIYGQPANTSCMVARHDESLCGMAARYFEPHPK